MVAAILHTDAANAPAFAADQIETARLRLRMFSDDDLDAMCGITSDPVVMRYIGYGRPLTREETRDNLEMITTAFRRRGYGRWALERRDTGELAGYCGLSSGNPEVGVEVGYMLARREWGQGLALEAARAALRYGFETLRMELISGLTLPGNRRSRRVLERLGMRFVRAARYFDFPCVHYAITRGEWRDDGQPYRLIRPQ